MMNGRQRARWYADQVSDLQRLHRQTREAPAEAVLVLHAIQKLHEARQLALASEGCDQTTVGPPATAQPTTGPSATGQSAATGGDRDPTPT